MGNFLKFLIETRGLTSAMRPTVKWMEKNYKKYNKLLFDNELPECNFEIFTEGNGEKNVFGYFHFRGENFFLDEDRRKLYKEKGNRKIYANSKNIVKLGKPTIELNGNFYAPEESWLNTLIHEMVHYWTMKDGNVPKLYHGKAFKDGCKMVSDKSKGKFKIKTLIDAEKMNFIFDKSIKTKKQLSKLRRQKTIDAKKKAVFFFFRNGNNQFLVSSNPNLIDTVVEQAKKNETPENRISKIIVSDDDWLIRDLKKMGFDTDVKKFKNFFALPRGKENMVYDGYDYKTIYSR